MYLRFSLVALVATLSVGASCPPTLPDPEEVLARVTALKGRVAEDDPRSNQSEVGEGMNGMWPDGVTHNFPNLGGRIFVDFDATATVNKWTETLVLTTSSDWLTPSPNSDFELEEVIADPALLAARKTTYLETELAANTAYWEDSYSFDYLDKPSMGSINALPSGISGTPYLVKNQPLPTGTLVTRGWLFRESLGSNKYRDHWLFHKDYKLTAKSTMQVEVHPESGGLTDLKAWLTAKVPPSTTKWYVQVTYTLVQYYTPTP